MSDKLESQGSLGCTASSKIELAYFNRKFEATSSSENLTAGSTLSNFGSTTNMSTITEGEDSSDSDIEEEGDDESDSLELKLDTWFTIGGKTYISSKVRPCGAATPHVSIEQKSTLKKAANASNTSQSKIDGQTTATSEDDTKLVESSSPDHLLASAPIFLELPESTLSLTIDKMDYKAPTVEQSHLLFPSALTEREKSKTYGSMPRSNISKVSYTTSPRGQTVLEDEQAASVEHRLPAAQSKKYMSDSAELVLTKPFSNIDLRTAIGSTSHHPSSISTTGTVSELLFPGVMSKMSESSKTEKSKSHANTIGNGHILEKRCPELFFPSSKSSSTEILKRGIQKYLSGNQDLGNQKTDLLFPKPPNKQEKPKWCSHQILKCTKPQFAAFLIPDNPSREKIPKSTKKTKLPPTLREMGYVLSSNDKWNPMENVPKTNIFDMIEDMLLHQKCTDVRVFIGKVYIACHGLVLHAYSGLLRKQLTGREELIELPESEVTPEVFKVIYTWMLTNEPYVHRGQLVEVFKSAEFLQVKALCDQCWSVFNNPKIFAEDTAFGVYLQARHFKVRALQPYMLSRINKYYLKLVASQEFVDFSPVEICALLKLNSICVNSEVEVFYSAIRWLSYCWKERKKYLANVMECIRFCLMPPWYLLHLQKGTTHETIIVRILANQQVAQSLQDAMAFISTTMSLHKATRKLDLVLEQLNMKVPNQRWWIYDKSCPLHHRPDCPNHRRLTYSAFIEYLKSISKLGAEYWRAFERIEHPAIIKCCTVVHDDY